MSSKGEIWDKVYLKTFMTKMDSENEESLVIKAKDLMEILWLAQTNFPKKEAAVVIGSDGEEHSYETYDTEEVERWFIQWFGK